MPIGRRRLIAGPPTDRASVAVEFEAVSKAFGSVQAASDVNLVIEDGEFFSMLGPSGFREDDLPPPDRRLRDPRLGSNPAPRRRRVLRSRPTTATSTRSSRTTPCSRT